jgi:TldD protein
LRRFTDDRSDGFGVRALVDGAWGFAASARFDDASLDATAAARAVAMARAGRGASRAAHRHDPDRRYVDHYATPVERDPATCRSANASRCLLDAERALHSAPTIAVGRAWLDLWRTDKEFYSTTGSRIAQTIYQSGGAISALAVGDGDAQVRMWPGDRGMYFGGGWEVIELARCARTRTHRRGSAPTALRAAVPERHDGRDPRRLAGVAADSRIVRARGRTRPHHGLGGELQRHEFPRSVERGKLHYGSPIVTIEIDNTMPRGFATVGYDDEGTKSVRSDIIRDGMLVGFESRATPRSNDRRRRRRACARRAGSTCR